MSNQQPWRYASPVTTPRAGALSHPYGVRRGFTLVELLVVIAIIAVLMSILMPAMNNARDVARTTVCQTRLHNLGNALGMYTADYANHIPFKPGWKGANASGLDGPTYEWLMGPYLGVKQSAWNPNTDGGHWSVDNLDSPAFWCPAAPIQRKRSYGLWYNQSADLWGTNNGYCGSFYNLYYHDADDKALVDNDDSDGSVNYSGAARVTVNFFPQPAATPYQFCAAVKFPSQLGGDGSGNIFTQHSSWHMRNSTNWIRPTLFIDCHTKTLTDSRYTDGVEHNYTGFAGSRLLRNGSITDPDSFDILEY